MPAGNPLALPEHAQPTRWSLPQQVPPLAVVPRPAAAHKPKAHTLPLAPVSKQHGHPRVGGTSSRVGSIPASALDPSGQALRAQPICLEPGSVLKTGHQRTSRRLLTRPGNLAPGLNDDGRVDGVSSHRVPINAQAPSIWSRRDLQHDADHRIVAERGHESR